MSLLCQISLLDSIQTLTITRPALELNLRAGKPYSVSWEGVKTFYDVKALDLDLYNKHLGCQCIIKFANGLLAIATKEVLEAASTGWNSGTGHYCKVIQCSDLVLLLSEDLAA